MEIDLSGFRKDVLGISQTQLAKMLGVSRDKVVRMENAPGKIELDMLIKLAQVTGQTLEEITGFSKETPKTFSVRGNWQMVQEFYDFIQSNLNYLKEEHKDCLTNEMLEMIEKYKEPVKPKVAVLGMPDAGKSTFLNSLLGSKELPAYWTPATSANIHIKHISDRPEYIKDEVIILNNENNAIEIERLTDHAHYEKYNIASGSVHVLQEFCTRKGKYYEDDVNYLIIVYLDYEILKVCDLIDVPGFGTDDRQLDDTMANATQLIADIIIYLSPANAFLRGVELQFLRNILNVLPPLERKNSNSIKPLGNFYVVASQAMTVDNGSVSPLKNILDEGANRLYTDTNVEIWDKKQEVSGYDYSLEVLQNRFFTFATDKHVLRNELEVDLKRLLEIIPEIVLKSSKEKAISLVHCLKQHSSGQFQLHRKLLQKREEYKKDEQDIIESMSQKEKENEKLRENVLTKIRALRSESINDFNKEYKKILNEDNITNIIKQNNYSKKKQDIKRLAGYISGELETRLEKILVNKSAALKEIIDEYLKNIDNNIRSLTNNSHNVNVKNTLFDVKNLFASGLAGMATLGGLAIWASTLGNLGGYIIVTQSVGLLSSIGISVGGTATAVSAVASIGGPITLGVALAIITGLSTFAITSGTWKKSVSKKIVKEYNKHGAFAKYEEIINAFWTDTEKAFEKADDNMKDQVKEQIQSLQQKINVLDADFLKYGITCYKELMEKIEQIIASLEEK